MTTPGQVTIILLALAANIALLLAMARAARAGPSPRHSLSDDPLLDHALSYARALPGVAPRDRGAQASSAASRSMLQELSATLDSLAERYRGAPLRIERFVAAGLSRAAADINRMYIRGSENHEPALPDEHALASSVERLVTAIRSRNTAAVYDALADLTFVTYRGGFPASPRGASEERAKIAHALERALKDAIRNAGNVTDPARETLLNTLKGGFYKLEDSHLLLLYLLFIEYHERLLGKKKSHSAMVRRTREWLNAWVVSDNANEYLAFAHLHTIVQRTRSYSDPAAYIMR